MASCTVVDVPKAIEFYRDILDFHCTFTNGDPISFAIMKRDAVQLMLQTERLGGVPGRNGCYIKLTGVESLYAEYQKKVVKIVHPLRTEEYEMKEFMIADPDGNTINFGEPATK
jgi:catechol 2,3-dioxygenase-like lactoylglutathione lyase family enzyme